MTGPGLVSHPRCLMGTLPRLPPGPPPSSDSLLHSWAVGAQGSRDSGSRPPGLQPGCVPDRHPCLRTCPSCERSSKNQRPALGDTYQVHQGSPGVPVLQGRKRNVSRAPSPHAELPRHCCPAVTLTA